MPLRPANADPLLPVWLLNAYRISLKPCGPGLSGPARPAWRDGGDGREAQDAGAQDEHDEHRHLHLEGLDLLAEVLGRPSDHEAGDEDREDRAHDEHAVQAGADPTRGDLTELDVEERDQAADRLEAVVPGVDRPGARAGRDGREQGADAGPELHLLAFHVAERLVHAGREERVAADLGVHRDDRADR